MNTYLIIISDKNRDIPIRDFIEHIGASWNYSDNICFLKTDLSAMDIYNTLTKNIGKDYLDILITKINASEEEFYIYAGMKLLTWLGFKFKKL